MTRKEEIQKKSENEPGTIDYQVGFSQGAQWADKTMIEKACEWLREYTDDYFVRDTDECWLREDDFIRDFKNYMEK